MMTAESFKPGQMSGLNRHSRIRIWQRAVQIGLITGIALLSRSDLASGQNQPAANPLKAEDVVRLLGGDVVPERVAQLSKERGIDFELVEATERQIRTMCLRTSSSQRCSELLVVLRSLSKDHLITRGVALANKGDWDAAISEYRKAIGLKPDDNAAHHYLGIALGAKGQLDGAVSELREAIRLFAGAPGSHAALGIALWRKRDWSGAIAEELEALRVAPSYGLAHFDLGMILEREGESQRAADEYRLATEADPSEARFKVSYERLLKQRQSGESWYRVGIYQGSGLPPLARSLTA